MISLFNIGKILSVVRFILKQIILLSLIQWIEKLWFLFKLLCEVFISVTIIKFGFHSLFEITIEFIITEIYEFTGIRILLWRQN